VNNIVILLTILMAGLAFPQTDKYAPARNKMVDDQIQGRGIRNPDVLKAMRKVPRHLFVPEEYMSDAYNDYPLPIGYGQTISQPYIVAYMTAAVNPNKNKRVLEVGTGSGYQAAVLAEIVKEVYTIEIVPELAKETALKLKQRGYSNIYCRSGDGYNGWPEKAPFDIIVVTAAAEDIPGPLISQLAENGRLIIPVGSASGIQELKLVTRKNGTLQTKKLLLVRFVPFKRL
jgi:protein-L-isoaspartate(D-aspartate) O-methyltransferase